MANFKSAIGTVGNAATVLYTGPAGRSAIITSATFSNITTAVHTVSVTMTKSGVTKSILFNATVPINGTLTLKPEAQVILESGDTLNAIADAANSVDFTVGATELVNG